MLDTIKAKLTGESEAETQPPTEDKRTNAEESMNTDTKVTGGRIPDDPADDYRYRAIWGERDGPTELPPDADASVTPLSASSAQLLSNGGRFGSAYCKIMYVPRGGWPANPQPGSRYSALASRSGPSVSRSNTQ